MCREGERRRSGRKGEKERKREEEKGEEGEGDYPTCGPLTSSMRLSPYVYMSSLPGAYG